jgi:hypothetical protein
MLLIDVNSFNLNKKVMITFKAKIENKDEWFEGNSLIKTSDVYIIVKGEMEWCDGSEWNSGRSDFQYIDIKTLTINNNINESIKITGCVETLDNWGSQEYNEQETYKLLISPDEWNDDQVFYGLNNQVYWIDDLINKQVTCGPITFTVQE